MCNFRKLCENKECELRFEKSFASHKKANEWKQSKNGNIKPINIIKGLGQKFYFTCKKCGHEYDAFLTTISEKDGCKYCRKFSEFLCEDDNCVHCFDNSFASSTFINLWKIELNNINPRMVKKNSSKLFHFNCINCNHVVLQKLNVVTKKNCIGCIYCSSTSLCDKFLETQECDFCFNKSFMSCEKVNEWDYSTNDKKPWEVFKSGTYVANFICSVCSHTYDYALNTITGQQVGCSYCSNRRLCLDNCETCFEKTMGSHPRVEEWIYEKNIKKPTEVFLGSHEKFWFKCKNCNTDYDQAPHKICIGRGCPHCKNKSERECKEIIEKLTGFEFIKLRTSWLNGYELDGYCEELSLAFEYDGEPHYKYIPTLFHKKGFHMLILQQIKDFIKTRICKNLNIRLIRIPYFVNDKEKFIEKKLKNFLLYD